ncbi:MAG: helix-turn-helix domain-containing protein [Clostridia bacterium]|nr:helix-turn-helix domain-containing protein [Clostridia bacterium]
MNAEKLGNFITERRKELGLTQAELAEKLHVTDKAVSRWERGLGFPDIHSLEPLASALEVSLVELMDGEKKEETVTKEAASEAVAGTISLSKLRWKKFRRNTLLWLGGILAAAALWLVLTGLMIRTDVFAYDYAVLPESGNAMMMQVGVASSMGYVRSGRVVENKDGRVVVRFYQAFGGFNSRLGAGNTFVIPLAEDTKEIWFDRGDREELIFTKDPATGEWKR